MPFLTEKLERCGYHAVKNFEDMLIGFDRMYERDGHTDTHTHRHTDRHTHRMTAGRACKASRGKNALNSLSARAPPHPVVGKELPAPFPRIPSLTFISNSLLLPVGSQIDNLL